MEDEREQMVAFLKATLTRERETRAKLASFAGRSMKAESFERYRAGSEANERELLATLAALGVDDA